MNIQGIEINTEAVKALSPQHRKAIFAHVKDKAKQKAAVAELENLLGDKKPVPDEQQAIEKPKEVQISDGLAEESPMVPEVATKKKK